MSVAKVKSFEDALALADAAVTHIQEFLHEK